MEVQIWTLIWILASAVIGLGVLFFMGYQHLSAKIDAQGAELRAADQSILGAITAQGAELRRSIDALGERLTTHLEHHTG